MAVQSERGKSRAALLEKYNAIVDEVETDPSLRLEFG